MTKNFTGTVHGETFEDRALFEAAAKDFRQAKRDAAPRGQKSDWSAVQGENADLVRRASGTWKAPRLSKDGKDFDPQGHEIGATRTLDLQGDLVEVQVWSEAPEGGLWVVTGDQRALWVRKSDGAAYDGLPTPGGYLGATVAEIAA